MNELKIKKMYVEEHVVRVVALQVIIISCIVLFTRSYWLALLLAADFALRAFIYIPAPLALVAKQIHKLLGWSNKPVFAPPKRFAATMGLFFCLAIFTCLYLSYNLAAYLIIGILLVCAGLESFFNICVGCYVYDILIAPFKNRQSQR